MSEYKKIFSDLLKTDNLSVSDVKKQLQSLYALKTTDLPVIYSNDGEKLPPELFAYLLVCHKKAARAKAIGIAADIEPLMHFVDEISFQKGLILLAGEYAGTSGPGKKKDVVIPILRYADAELTKLLLERSTDWSHAPRKSLYQGLVGNKSRCAMIALDEANDLDKYAKKLKIDFDQLRAEISDLGLNDNLEKCYTIEGENFVAQMQSDYTFTLHKDNGETTPFLSAQNPKNPEYVSSKMDLAELQYCAPKIIEIRKSILLRDFLSGRKVDASVWQQEYLSNPLLSCFAESIIWCQGDVTFIIKNNLPVMANRIVYTLSDEKISVAHPMDMDKETILSWQKYVVENKILQPFEQIWEPVIDPQTVASNRYEGCRIPFVFFENRKQHGITVQRFGYNGVTIALSECNAQIEIVDTEFSEFADFELWKIEFEQFSKSVNHHIAYFDFLTVDDRIKKDDDSIGCVLSTFTYAQIAHFIDTATTYNATKTLALLLDYKNKNFADFDPMEEFVLE